MPGPRTIYSYISLNLSTWNTLALWHNTTMSGKTMTHCGGEKTKLSEQLLNITQLTQITWIIGMVFKVARFILILRSDWEIKTLCLEARPWLIEFHVQIPVLAHSFTGNAVNYTTERQPKHSIVVLCHIRKTHFSVWVSCLLSLRHIKPNICVRLNLYRMWFPHSLFSCSCVCPTSHNYNNERYSLKKNSVKWHLFLQKFTPDHTLFWLIQENQGCKFQLTLRRGFFFSSFSL